MVKKRAANASSSPNLLVSRMEAAQSIGAQIEKGRLLRDLRIDSEEDLSKAGAAKSKWSDYNHTLLTRLFDSDSFAREFSRSAVVAAVWPRSFDLLVSDFRRNMGGHITALESILERLELIPEPGDRPMSPATSEQNPSLSRDVFVVHGTDEPAKQSVARFLEKLDLHPVILHEQPNKGRTIIEKFEDYADVGFAVVLLTPDDIGGLSGTPPGELKLRARQNVILELGYFLGKLRRDRVCALYKEGVEIPSDYQGVLYVPMDPNGGWRLELAKEIKQAGIEVDLNRAL